MTESQGGARRYSWPPFEPGNEAAVKHGAESPRLVSEHAAGLLAELEASGAPWLETVDAVLLDSWLYALAACQRVRRWLDENGLLDDAGKPRAAADLWLRIERRLDRATMRLGFDPVARAGLARDSAMARHLAADAVAEAASVGREARMRALADGVSGDSS